MALGSHLITVRRLEKYINDVIGKKANLPNTNKTIIGNISQINSDLTQEVSRATSQDNVLSARIDQIASLPSGSTSGDAELLDIRVGADGITYTSAGGAVRGQVTDLKSVLNITRMEGNNRIVYSSDVPNNLIIPYELIPGKYVDTDGVEQSSVAFSVTPYIEITPSETYYFAGTGLMCWYDETKTFISYAMGSYTTRQAPSTAKYMRVDISTAASTEDTFVCKGSIRLPYDDGLVKYKNRFKPYESGWIDFTVPVNTVNYNTNHNQGHSDETLDSQVLENVNCVLKLPATYTRDGSPTKLLMLCHGAGKGVNTTDTTDTWLNNADYVNLVDAFVSHGYAVFDCNGYGNVLYKCNFWGNRRGVQAWKNAYQYIINNYNVEQQFSIYGFSMGGLTAIAIAGDMFPNIKCIALGSPVTNLKASWDNGNNNLIAETYGMNSDAVYEADRVIGCDPASSIVEINNVEYFTKQLPPIKVWFGSLETQPSPTDAQRMVNAIKNSNGLAMFRLVDGAVHDICWGADTKITAEYVTWVNRWNTV